MKREELLRKLLDLSEPSELEIILIELSELNWDSEEIVIVSQENIQNVLVMYEEGQFSEKQIEDWANTIELRDDIGYQNEVLKEVIEELANPVLYGSINSSRINELFLRLH